MTAHTVLAVDDEPANQRAVRRALLEDCTVLTAGSAAEGLAILAREPVALVISDHRMPGMTGTAFLAETVTRHPELIRVVLTGYAAVDVLLEAINRGHVYHVLGKPWATPELRLVVRRGLERYEALRERERLIAELRVACARAERAAEQQTRLLALAAHELGTPIHLLLNALELMRGGPRGDAASWLDMAQRAAEWLARGAAQLHTASRLQRAELPLAPRPVALAPLAAEVVTAVRTAAAERTLDLRLDGEAEVVALVDPPWCAQALLALLINAVRFTPDGGQVRVRVGAAGAAAELAVIDTGIGIPAAALPHCCEPFSSAGGDLLLHGSGRFAFGARGLGLGLATARGIAAAHGGTLTVESTPDRGTCVRLRLPRATQPSRDGSVHG